MMRFAHRQLLVMFKSQRFLASVVSLALLGWHPTVMAEDLLEHGTPTEESIRHWDGFDRLEDDPQSPSGKSFVVGGGEQTIFGSERFLPEEDGIYTLTVSARAASSENETKLWVGLVPYDDAGERIQVLTVNPVAESGTELTQDCFEDDTVIHVADGSHWGEGPLRFVAFETDNSGEFADLPNRNLSNSGILKVEKKDTHWEITLGNPVGKAYPAGTPIRLHEAGANFIYCTMMGGNLTEVAEPVAGTVTGFSITNSANEFWPGTAAFGVVVLKDAESKGEAFIESISLEK